MAYRNQRYYEEDLLIETAGKIGVVGFGIACALVALPAIIIAFFGQRYTVRNFTWGYRTWLLLLLFSLYPLYQVWQHGWPDLITKELADVYLNAQLHQTDFGHWPLKQLWSEVWPLWLRSLLLTPAIAVFMESSSQIEQRVFLRLRRQVQERRAERARRRAQRRSSRPGRVADAIGNEMVMGIPIRDEQEDS